MCGGRIPSTEQDVVVTYPTSSKYFFPPSPPHPTEQCSKPVIRKYQHTSYYSPAQRSRDISREFEELKLPIISIIGNYLAMNLDYFSEEPPPG